MTTTQHIGAAPLHAVDVEQHLERRTAALFAVPATDPARPVDA